MIWPPMLLRLRVSHEGRRRWGCWLPLLLLWPFALALMLLFLPLALLASVFAGRWRKTLLLGGPILLAAIWNARGLVINVRGTDEEIHISLC